VPIDYRLALLSRASVLISLLAVDFILLPPDRYPSQGCPLLTPQILMLIAAMLPLPNANHYGLGRRTRRA
jgi:hypothetical protein